MCQLHHRLLVDVDQISVLTFLLGIHRPHKCPYPHVYERANGVEAQKNRPTRKNSQNVRIGKKRISLINSALIVWIVEASNFPSRQEPQTTKNMRDCHAIQFFFRLLFIDSHDSWKMTLRVNGTMLITDCVGGHCGGFQDVQGCESNHKFCCWCSPSEWPEFTQIV